MGTYYPTIFLLLFSLIVILGDFLINRDSEVQQFSYPNILNISIHP